MARADADLNARAQLELRVEVQAQETAAQLLCAVVVCSERRCKLLSL